MVSIIRVKVKFIKFMESASELWSHAPPEKSPVNTRQCVLISESHSYTVHSGEFDACSVLYIMTFISEMLSPYEKVTLKGYNQKYNIV